MSSGDIMIVGFSAVLLLAALMVFLLAAAGIRRRIDHLRAEVRGGLAEVRHDLTGRIREYQTDKHVLFGRQEGRCNGCRETLPFRNMQVDHIIPRAKDGPDHIDNYQLLCPACNNLKGTGSQEEFFKKLKERGIRPG